MRKQLLSLMVTACFIILAIPFSESTNDATVTFVKILPDGTIEYLEEHIEVVQGRNLSKAIAERCGALLEEDERFQSLIDQQTGLYLIVSAGQGLHLAIPPALFEIRLLRISLNIIPSIIESRLY